MKTDRELLELAARAAGIDVDAHDCFGAYIWDPLNDDGDALRLAVKLRMMIDASNDGHEVMAASPTGHHWTEICGLDAYSATRRAIVRAAAEIGEGMK